MAEAAHLRVIGARMTSKLCITMSVELRRQLEREANAAGYSSVSGYVRDHKLRIPARAVGSKVIP